MARIQHLTYATFRVMAAEHWAIKCAMASPQRTAAAATATVTATVFHVPQRAVAGGGVPLVAGAGATVVR